jgi:putative acetyltransferase
MHIRDEDRTDEEGVRALHRAAFEDDAEARLVDLLREEAMPLISLVAEEDGLVVGHILFSPATVGTDDTGMGLAPMAVAPDRQGTGIGAALVGAGLKACGELGIRWVVVLGHPEYYPRFGFVPASRFGVTSEYDVPDEVFMAMELEEGALATGGRALYHPAFATIEGEN